MTDVVQLVMGGVTGPVTPPPLPQVLPLLLLGLLLRLVVALSDKHVMLGSIVVKTVDNLVKMRATSSHLAAPFHSDNGCTQQTLRHKSRTDAHKFSDTAGAQSLRSSEAIR